MKLAFSLLPVLILSGCSTAIYKTGWHPKDGTPRTEILVKLGEPATTTKSQTLPATRMPPFPTVVNLRDSQGREDRYLTRRVIADRHSSAGTVWVRGLGHPALELLLFPYAAWDHWFPQRKSLTIFYDRHDKVQGYYLDSIRSLVD